MKKILEKLHIFGYRRWQPLFSRIEYYCLVGMNMGRGGATSSSGEEAVLSYISKKSHAHLTVFDVGANVGLYTRLIKESLPTTTSIHSFEPTKHAFKQLLANVAGLSNVHLNNLGLSDKKGSIELFSDVAGSGLGSVYNRRLDHFGVHNTKKEQIEMTDIDSYCKEHKIARIDFLKIDVEGHELKVLEGAKNMLSTGAITYIQFEFGGCNIDSRTFFQDFWYLLKDKYTIYRIVQDGLYPVKEYSERDERFINTNFFAEKK